MYFSIHKTLSRFRSSSEASSSTDYASVLPTWRRSSMSKIEGLFNTASTSRENSSSHARSLSDSGVLSPKVTTVGVTPTLFPVPSLPQPQGAPPHEILQSKADKFLQALLKENKILRNENTYLKYEAQVREEELAIYRSKRCAENFNSAVRKHILGSTSERCEASAKPTPLKSSRPPLKFYRPAENRVGEAGSRKGATAGVIQTAVPVSAAKTNDCIETMTSTKDNNNATRAQRVIKTHKPTRRVDLSSADSDRLGISIRENKMDDLLKQLKTGSVTLAPTTAARIPSYPVESSSISHAPIYVSAYNRGRNLAPLASEILKDEVKGSLSHGKGSSAKKFWSVLNEVDINRTGSRIGSCGAKQSIQCSGTSAKALGKRKAILLEHPSPDSAIDVRGKSISNELQLRANATIESHLPPLSPETLTTRSAGDPGALSAEKALLSLERICAGFSSGSLGSLESTSDPSSVIDPLVDVPSLFVVDTTVAANKLLSVRSRNSSEPESPSFSRLSVKTSTPSVSRYRSSILSSPFRPAATSSPKMMPHSISRTTRKYTSPLHLTKVMDTVSPSSTPTKEIVHKHISPLRITKKGKDNVLARPSPARA